MSLKDTTTDTTQGKWQWRCKRMKRDERGEAWAVPRKWRQYLLKDAPIYILRSC